MRKPKRRHVIDGAGVHSQSSLIAETDRPTTASTTANADPTILAVGNREDDHNWPEPDRVGRQELEVKLGKEHISFTVRKSFAFHAAACPLVRVKVGSADICVLDMLTAVLRAAEQIAAEK